MKKILIIINGPPGIGKTVVCRELQTKLKRIVWLDGDWCWKANPWIVTEETNNIAEDNMVYILKNFLNCSEYRYVIFSWIFRKDAVFNSILARLKDRDFDVHKFTLTCDEHIFHERLKVAGREKDKIRACIDLATSCNSTDSKKVDTTNVSISDVANTILDIIKIDSRTQLNNVGV